MTKLKIDYDREWRARQLARGHCSRCGRSKQGATLSTCAICRARQQSPESVLRRRARQNARAARIRVERRAAGLPVGRGHVNGLGDRPCDREVLTPEQRIARGRNGGIAAGLVASARLTKEAIVDARRMLLMVRSDFTAEQVADLERVVAVVYRKGRDRGYAAGRQARYDEAKRQKAREAA